jgi:3-phosphoshikimate 1-carboxyvinyltransferase
LTIEPGSPHGARIETYDDHRIAMAFALLGLRVPGIEIADPGCVAKTFPTYFEALDALR